MRPKHPKNKEELATKEYCSEYECLSTKLGESCIEGLENSTKKPGSEYTSNTVHPELYAKVKNKLGPLRNRVVAELGVKDKRLEIENELVELRNLLDKNPLERKVQDALVALEKQTKSRTAIFNEVCVIKRSGKPGRIDILVLPSNNHEMGRILELKRPSFKLVVFRGGIRSSKPLTRALKQVGDYSESNLRVHQKSQDLTDQELGELKKTIVAGRSYSFSDPYIAIATEETTQSVDIYSWDAWIDRFERIYT